MSSLKTMVYKIFFVTFCYIFDFSHSTIDINRAELQMVADSLTSSECRRLLESLHRDDYILDPFPSGNHVPKKIPCRRLLEHWNTHEANNETYHLLALRLEQMGKINVADRLSRSVNREESNALRRDFHLPEIKDPEEEKHQDISNMDISKLFLSDNISKNFFQMFMKE
ncbi:uncharacterized protein [Centruroides vittatus]|uniref:uncharacterized protein n=1 Tax=Centruroides vittatus TaxID=120091 RepID=UPI00350ED21B